MLFLNYGKVNGGRLKIFCENSIGAFLIVFLFIKNSYRPASDMTYFIDIYLRVKRTEHKGDIRYFIICAKAD